MEPASKRLALRWSTQGRADVRAIDRATALEILHCLDRFLLSRSGDVKKLRPPETGHRLRCGDYRLFFEPGGPESIDLLAVRHRSVAYRLRTPLR